MFKAIAERTGRTNWWALRYIQGALGNVGAQVDWCIAIDFNCMIWDDKLFLVYISYRICFY